MTAKTYEELEAECRELRLLLAIRVGRGMLYTDDGELQDNSVAPFIDFKRDSAAEIGRKLQERGRRSLNNHLLGDPSQSG